MKTVIIQGSSRSHGNTKKIIDLIGKNIDFDLVDLSSKNIRHFDYDLKNKEDDFLGLFKRIVHDYDVILFATPVYWYAMSGIMKTFFDRITDFLKMDKETGRKLRGKYMGAISCGSDKNEIEGFFLPFKRSAEYLGMQYVGDVHTWVSEADPDIEVENLVKHYSNQIKKFG